MQLDESLHCQLWDSGQTFYDELPQDINCTPTPTLSTLNWGFFFMYWEKLLLLATVPLQLVFIGNKWCAVIQKYNMLYYSLH